MRPETGTMKFKEDWCGVFIRGDNAFMFRLALNQILKNPLFIESADMATKLAVSSARGLIDLLTQSDEKIQREKDDVHQDMRPFTECVATTNDVQGSARQVETLVSPHQCVWKPIEDSNSYQTECGQEFVMLDDSKPTDFNYCCYCGNKLVSG